MRNEEAISQSTSKRTYTKQLTNFIKEKILFVLIFIAPLIGAVSSATQ
jgi:hypothetical protein